MTRFLVEPGKYEGGYFLRVDWGDAAIPVLWLPDEYWLRANQAWLDNIAFAIMSRVVADEGLVPWWASMFARDFLVNCPPTGWELTSEELGSWMDRVNWKQMHRKPSPWSK